MISAEARGFEARRAPSPTRKVFHYPAGDPAGSSATSRRGRVYTPAWWERRFPWVLDVLASMDPDPLLARIAELAEPVVSLVEAVAQPLADAQDAIGSFRVAVQRWVFDGLGACIRALPLPSMVRRWLWIEAPLLRDEDDCAHLAFKRQYGVVLPLALVTAVVAHAAVFVMAPPITIAEVTVEAPELVALELPPDVQIPSAPAAIARPATPVIGTTEIDSDITIAPTTFEAFVDVDLPPPPPPVSEETVAEEVPTFTPYTVAPSILNPGELQELMSEEYPPLLRNAGIGGTVKVMAHIDEDGNVDEARIAESSGYELLDEAALRVGMQIRCSPALNRDVAVSAWISVPLEFVVR